MILFPVLALLYLFTGCGEGSVEIGDDTYQPQLVIEGYLYPGQNVSDIKISRNLPITVNRIDSLSLFIPDADVRITDISKNKIYNLTYNKTKHSYEYIGDSLFIEYGNSYKLTVRGKIDNKDLQASSTTIVPQKGFKILEDLSELGTLKYREKAPSGDLKNFSITIKPSPGTDFYAISSNSLDASVQSFIYDNPIVKYDVSDVNKGFFNLKYQMRRLMDINSYGESVNYKIDWFDVWFYGRYRIIIYACDDNFKYYILTHASVKEIDGNFHEPRMFFEGDGIGVFGSAITDTVYFSVTP